MQRFILISMLQVLLIAFSGFDKANAGDRETCLALTDKVSPNGKNFDANADTTPEFGLNIYKSTEIVAICDSLIKSNLSPEVSIIPDKIRSCIFRGGPFGIAAGIELRGYVESHGEHHSIASSAFFATQGSLASENQAEIKYRSGNTEESFLNNVYSGYEVNFDKNKLTLEVKQLQSENPLIGSDSEKIEMHLLAKCRRVSKPLSSVERKACAEDLVRFCNNSEDERKCLIDNKAECLQPKAPKQDGNVVVPSPKADTCQKKPLCKIFPDSPDCICN